MSPVIGSRLKCERCREEMPPHHYTNERIRLKRGPDGERLCMKHFNMAWDQNE